MQTAWFKKEKDAFGGSLLTTRKERARRRPLSTKHTMHLVLRSSQAKGPWSLRKKGVEALIKRQADKYGVKILEHANVGNHLHIHLKLGNRHTYPAFIRALTGAIAQLITGASKLKKLTKKFWDRRPYTRIVRSRRGYMTLKDYMKINRLEGAGWARDEAQWFTTLERAEAFAPFRRR